MNKNMRIGLVGLVGAVAGFGLQGCFTAQPPFECQITNSQAGYSGVGPFYVKLTTAAPCGVLGVDYKDDGGISVSHMRLGAQRYHPPGTNEFTVAYRASPLVDIAAGYDHEGKAMFSANSDPSNDCVDTDIGCDVCVSNDPARPADGGLITPSGEVVLCPDGTYSLDDGNACDATTGTPIDVANTCELVPDGVERVDPSDPGPRPVTSATPPSGRCLDSTGKPIDGTCPVKALGKGKITQFPDKVGICTITETTSATQTYQAETVDLVDGGTEVLPAVTVKLEWTDFGVYNTTKVPATAFKAKLKYTEGSCVVNYNAIGFYPEIPCSRAAEMKDGGNDMCDPFPRDPKSRVDGTAPDGGFDPSCANRYYGSCSTGSTINPSFNPKCDLRLNVCVPNVDLDTLK